MKDFASQDSAEPTHVEDTLVSYHRMFKPYFEEYASLELNTYDISSSTDVAEMIRAAEAQGLDVHAFPSLPARRMIISDGTRQVGFAAAQPSCMKPILTDFCDDKLLQKAFYEENGIPHAEGHEVQSLEHALDTWRSLGDSVVLKPSRGRQGIGVTVDIRDDESLIRAWNLARADRPQSPVMIEKTFVGCDLRAVILNKKVICAYLKIPPNVLGDGHSTIETLVREKNARRAASPALRVAMIKTDDKARQILGFQGFHMQSVPAEGEPVLLGLTQSVSSGGDLLPINGRLSSPVNSVACSVAKALGYTGPLGMDVLCRDFEDKTGTAIICETNPQPAMFGALYPPVGQSVNCAEKIILHYFGAKPKKPSTKLHRIHCEGAKEIELQAFCDAFAETYEAGPVLTKTGAQELTLEGTDTEASALLSVLLDSQKKPKFIDAAYIVTPLKKPRTRKSTIALETPEDKVLQASDLIAQACLAAKPKHAEIRSNNCLLIKQGRKTTFASMQLNGWYAQVHSTELGRRRLRHILAMHGLPITRNLILEPTDVRGLRRAVARLEQDCTITMITRSGIQMQSTVATADDASALLSENLSDRTRLVHVSATESKSSVDLLVFDGSLVAATQVSGPDKQSLHSEWHHVASACMGALPSARLMSVRVSLDDPANGPDDQVWAIDSIDTNPDVAKFGKRAADPKGAFAKKLVSALLESTI